MPRDGAEVVEQARKYLANLNKETGANVQKDLGQYWANYGQGPDMTQEADAICEKAIKEGTWGKSNQTEPTEVYAIQEVTAYTVQENAFLQNALWGAAGFIIGAMSIALFFKIKINCIKADCETRVSEARAALDRMLKIASKE